MQPLREILCPQRHLVDLADAGFLYCFNEFDLDQKRLPRQHPFVRVVLDVGGQLFLGDPGIFFQYDERHGYLSPREVGLADYRRLGHGRVRGEDVLQLQ